MTRNELLSTPAYWLAKTQTQLYYCAEKFMKEKNMNRTQLAEYLGVSKGYVTQLLNGDYNFSIEKYTELCIKLGYVPEISITKLEDKINSEVTSFEPIRPLRNNYCSYEQKSLRNVLKA